MALNSTLANYHTAALSAALVTALPGVVDGVSGYGPTRPISVLLNGQDAVLTAGQETTAQSIFNLHDPVLMSVDKTSILADGTDTAIITVSAPKTGAGAVTLICTKPDGSTQTEAITLTSGVGTMALTTSLEGTYRISVQSSANTSTDQIVIVAA